MLFIIFPYNLVPLPPKPVITIILVIYYYKEIIFKRCICV